MQPYSAALLYYIFISSLFVLMFDCDYIVWKDKTTFHSEQWHIQQLERVWHIKCSLWQTCQHTSRSPHISLLQPGPPISLAGKWSGWTSGDLFPAACFNKCHLINNSETCLLQRSSLETYRVMMWKIKFFPAWRCWVVQFFWHFKLRFLTL